MSTPIIGQGTGVPGAPKPCKLHLPQVVEWIPHYDKSGKAIQYTARKIYCSNCGLLQQFEDNLPEGEE